MVYAQPKVVKHPQKDFGGDLLFKVSSEPPNSPYKEQITNCLQSDRLTSSD